jgi:hypothetical protein
MISGMCDRCTVQCISTAVSVAFLLLAYLRAVQFSIFEAVQLQLLPMLQASIS